MRLMCQVSTDKAIDSLVTGIVRLMMIYHEADPKFFLNMPSTTFDIMVEETIKIMKEDKNALERPSQRGVTFGYQ
jgi:hypothetical protein